MKKILIGAAVVFVVKVILDIVIHGVLMGAQYEATKEIWRADMMDLMWINYVINAVTALCLAWIYSYGHQNKGILEGVRFGAVVGVMLSIGTSPGIEPTMDSHTKPNSRPAASGFRTRTERNVKKAP